VLDYRNTPTGLQTRQYCRRPAVYLDHWAFALFSRETELRQAFIEALAERGGTLTLGRLNLLEFSRVTNEPQLRAAEDFVQAVLPRIFFVDTRPMPVVERETAQEAGAWGDEPLFIDFGKPLLIEQS
jgi:hypothetical protein